MVRCATFLHGTILLCLAGLGSSDTYDKWLAAHFSDAERVKRIQASEDPNNVIRNSPKVKRAPAPTARRLLQGSSCPNWPNVQAVQACKIEEATKWWDGCSSCDERAKYLMDKQGKSMLAARLQVAGEFPDLCSCQTPAPPTPAPPTTFAPTPAPPTPAPPTTFAPTPAPPTPAPPTTFAPTPAPSSCPNWPNVRDVQACKIEEATEWWDGCSSCDERAQYLMNKQGKSMLAARLQVAGEFPDLCSCQGGSGNVCRRWNDIKAVKACQPPIGNWDGCSSCEERVLWVMRNRGQNFDQARLTIAAEWPQKCPCNYV